MDNLSELSDEELYLRCCTAEKEYNSVRMRLRTESDRYFRQSVFSDYVKEDDIIQLASKCAELKKNVQALRNELKARGRMRHNPFRWMTFADAINYDFKLNHEYDQSLHSA